MCGASGWRHRTETVPRADGSDQKAVGETDPFYKDHADKGGEYNDPTPATIWTTVDYTV